MDHYNFLCIDIVGSSIEVDSQVNNIEDLLGGIKDFLSGASEEQLQTSFTGDGAIIWFKKDSLLPLQLALSIHQRFPPCNVVQSFGLKIGIARDRAEEIESAKSILGIPVWGKGPTFARRLCDLCDNGHILMDENAFKFFTENYRKMTRQHFGFNIVDNRFLRLGRFFVKHRNLFMFTIIAIPRMKKNYLFLETWTFQETREA